MNALAAAAAAVALDIPLEVIAAGLQQFLRYQGPAASESPVVDGATVIDDTYNANPESMRAAIAVLARAAGKKLLVLGDMGELGQAGAVLYTRSSARCARDAGVDRLFALGELSKLTTAAFGSRCNALRAHRGSGGRREVGARAGRDRAGQRLAVHADGARGAGDRFARGER